MEKPLPDSELARKKQEQESREFGDMIINLHRSEKSRSEKPDSYPERFPVPVEQALWSDSYPDYDPPYHVEQVVIDNDSTEKEGGWADPEDILLKVSRPIESYEGEIKFDKAGRPKNPLTRTGIEGRGLLGKWGPNFAADPIISRLNPSNGELEIAMIKRVDNGQWAIPGGMVDEGEDVSQTIEREFQEEAGVAIDMSEAQPVYKGYVDDPRNTDNAWMETTAKHLHLPKELAEQIDLHAGSDANEVQWMSINGENISNLFASHGSLIQKAIEQFYEDNPDLYRKKELQESEDDSVQLTFDEAWKQAHITQSDMLDHEAGKLRREASNHRAGVEKVPLGDGGWAATPTYSKGGKALFRKAQEIERSSDEALRIAYEGEEIDMDGPLDSATRRELARRGYELSQELVGEIDALEQRVYGAAYDEYSPSHDGLPPSTHDIERLEEAKRLYSHAIHMIHVAHSPSDLDIS